MKKQLRNLFFFGSVLFLSASCTVSYINTDTLKRKHSTECPL